ncbi:hypothetical protein C8R44DRAFT_868555 [Mycena epipterygia]|nr:hypothetical protein C8R44DRAFT_868555 [Mycena epipterygia]
MEATYFSLGSSLSPFSQCSECCNSKDGTFFPFQPTPLETYTCRAGGALESSNIQIWSARLWEDETKPFFQKICQHTTNLRDFSFLCDIEGLLGIIDTFSFLPASDWNVIHVCFDAQESDLTTSPLWSQIDDILAEWRFCSLKRFSVNRGIALSQLENLLPRANARGIIT